MTIVKNLAAVGVARQAAKGTPAAQPQFFFGLRGGNAITVDLDQSEEERTLAAKRSAPGVNRLKVVHGMQFTARLHPRTIGLLVYGALGAIATSGSGPFTHVETPAGDLPYLTFWGQFAGGIYRVQDCKIDELSIKWDGPGPLEVDVTAWGGVPGYPSSITPVVDEQFADYYQAGGGTFKIDSNSGTPAVAPITKGEIKISNGVEPLILATSVVPQDVIIGHQSIELGLTLVPDDLAHWRAIVTGTDSGTTISEAPVYGSYDQLFVLGTNSLQVVGNRVAFAADFPEVDPAGGASELELVGTAVLGTAGADALTATVINAHASY